METRERRAYQLSYYKKRRLKFIMEAGGACEECGYDEHPVILEFAHKIGCVKVGNVTELMRRSNEIIQTEIAKCFLLCPTCHKLYDYGLLV